MNPLHKGIGFEQFDRTARASFHHCTVVPGSRQGPSPGAEESGQAIDQRIFTKIR